jgi:chemotaxis protein MotB
MAGKGGGAWKVAYADFVTAMMAFFLVMWITAQSAEVKEAISHHFNDPFAPVLEDQESDAGNPKPSKFAAPARPSHEDETEAGGGGRSLLLVSQGGDRTSIGTVVRFAEESAELDAAARQQLDEFVPYVAGKPQRLEIRGHSTRRPLPPGSPFRDHWQLAYARCLVVMAALEERGVPRERMRLSQAAGNEPLSAPDTQLAGGGHARVEVNLLNETAFPATRPDSNGPNKGVPGQKRVLKRTPSAEPGGSHGNAPHGESSHGAAHGSHAVPAGEKHQKHAAPPAATHRDTKGASAHH